MVQLRKCAAVAACLFSIANGVGAAPSNPLRIYVDADRTRHYASARSIEMGIKTAFDQAGNTVQGRPVEIVLLDHRGNVALSRLNVEKAVDDPQTLFLLGGMHSPPLIHNRGFINEQRLLTLVPWAAGGPITRHPEAENWIFRLSVDDEKAGVYLSRHATTAGTCKVPHLLLEHTAWGESNRRTMSEALRGSTGNTPDVTWFNWGASLESARIMLRHIAEHGSDCLIFVGNATDGPTFIEAMLSLETDQRRPIYSHWGITGGNFFASLPPGALEEVHLRFIQSCFSLLSEDRSTLSREVFAHAQSLFPELKSERDLRAPAGFAHAYDIGSIVLSALSQFTLVEDMDVNRDRLRTALEHLQKPVAGLVKTYRSPFGPSDGKDGHEALGYDDLCMAAFGADGEIVLTTDRPNEQDDS